MPFGTIQWLGRRLAHPEPSQRIGTMGQVEPLDRSMPLEPPVGLIPSTSISEVPRLAEPAFLISRVDYPRSYQHRLGRLGRVRSISRCLWMTQISRMLPSRLLF